MSKIIFKNKKNIIVIYFKIKNTLKKQLLRISQTHLGSPFQGLPLSPLTSHSRTEQIQ
jgi:hypothetical protein